MSDRIIGQVKRVNGPVIEVMGITDAHMFELVRVGDKISLVSLLNLIRTVLSFRFMKTHPELLLMPLFMARVCSFRSSLGRA